MSPLQTTIDPKTVKKKRELFLGLVPASRGSLVLPLRTRGPEGPTLSKLWFRILNLIPFRPSIGHCSLMNLNDAVRRKSHGDSPDPLTLDASALCFLNTRYVMP